MSCSGVRASADPDPVPTERRAERRDRVRVQPDDVVDRDVVDAGEVVRRSQEMLRRLHVDGTAAAAAEMLQVDLPSRYPAAMSTPEAGSTRPK